MANQYKDFPRVVPARGTNYSGKWFVLQGDLRDGPFDSGGEARAWQTEILREQALAKATVGVSPHG